MDLNSFTVHDAAFIMVLHSFQKHLSVSDAEIASILHAPTSTITRWKEGKNLPWRAIRPRICSILQRELDIRNNLG